MIFVAGGRIEQEHHATHAVTMTEWRSSGVLRVARSTLAPESYSLSETSEAVDWTRAVMGELLCPECEQWCVFEKQRACLVTDAVSLYNVLIAEKATLPDRRLSLEAAMLRETMKGQVRADVGGLHDDDWCWHDVHRHGTSGKIWEVASR